MKSIFSRNGIFCALGLTSTVVMAGTSAVAQVATSAQTLTSAHTVVVTPVPGTTVTTSAALMQQSDVPATQEQTQEVAIEQVTTKQVAQADIDPGRTTRGGSSYIGVAGNIGLGGGDSALGDGNFAVMSKVGLTRTFSARPAAIFGDNTTILIPATYDFSLQQPDDPFVEPLPIAPYVGVGAAIKTGDDSQLAFMVTGGVDFPLTQQFTATAAINAGFFDQTDVGLLIGVGYNFGGF